MNTEHVLALVAARSAARSGRGRRLRCIAGLSQAEVAAACGVTAATVSRWESGTRAPHGSAAMAYADLLDHLERLSSGAAA